MSELVMGGELGDFGVSGVLEAVSLSRQHTRITLWDQENQPTGEVRIKSGHVLAVECQSEEGQPAFRLLLRRLHHSFRVEKLPDPARFVPPVGRLFDLMSSVSSLQVQSDSNRVNVSEVQPVGSDPAGPKDNAIIKRAARPSATVPPPPAPPAFRDQTNVSGAERPRAGQSALGGVHPGRTAVPKDRIFPCSQSLARSLNQVPELKSLVKLQLPNIEVGEYWSRDGAQISVSDLAAFGIASFRTRRELPAQDAFAGYRVTAEHYLGCVVTDIDMHGMVHICLFDRDAPLGLVRHAVKRVLSLSGTAG